MLFLLKTKVDWPADYSPGAMSSLHNTAMKKPCICCVTQATARTQEALLHDKEQTIEPLH